MATDFLSKFEHKKEYFISEWKEYLSIPSISADKTYRNECLKAFQWLSKKLLQMGFSVSQLASKNDANPILLAELKGDITQPTILLYGHYDVQPVDPVNSWETPPFEPTIRDDRMYARGAQDNKGQLLYAIHALETLKGEGARLGTIKILVEGEEEIGSSTLSTVVASNSDALKADLLLVTDIGTMHESLGTITMGLRGIVSCEIRIKGPRYDLHSGVHGGLVSNPATALARAVASLHNVDGSIAVEGYYDQIIPPSEIDRQLANAVPYQVDQYTKQVGVRPEGGERGYSIAERRGFRPTIEVNGIHGGYGGPGGKTIIPAEASVKLSMRLASGQDPAKALSLVIEHLKKQVPADLTFELVASDIGGPALSLSSSTKSVALARDVLKEITGNEAICMWEGASIPVVPALAKAAGAETLLVGFGLEEDCIHAPNESFKLSQYSKGFQFVGKFCERLWDEK